MSSAVYLISAGEVGVKFERRAIIHDVVIQYGVSMVTMLQILIGFATANQQNFTRLLVEIAELEYWADLVSWGSL